MSTTSLSVVPIEATSIVSVSVALPCSAPTFLLSDPSTSMFILPSVSSRLAAATLETIDIGLNVCFIRSLKRYKEPPYYPKNCQKKNKFN